MESDDETEPLRSVLMETSANVFEVKQRAEEEIRRANEALERRTSELAQAIVIMQATLAATSDAILVTNDRNEVVDFNDQYTALWSTPLQVLLARSADRVKEHASRNFANPGQFIERIQEILKTDQESFDVLELKDGRIFEQHSKALRIEGEVSGRVWCYRDVSDRHAADIASRRLAAIVASSDDGIIGKDLRSIITSWNAGAERIFGYTAKEMIGASIMRLIPPDRRAEETQILNRLKSGERLDHFETVRTTKDGRSVNVSISVSPIKDSEGTVVGASKIVRDITAAKELEKAMQRAIAEADSLNRERLRLLESEREARSRAELASRMKDEFLATLSHELRTPLNAVLGWVNILRMDDCEGEELKEGLGVIERNAKAQAQIIEDLLDMSRIISGKVRLDAQPVNLPAVLNESIDTVRATANAKGVILQATIEPFAGSINGDPHRLQQVFWNLLNNAIKFTPRDGKVRASLRVVDSSVEITVADTGEGIAREFLPIIFDRFQQGDASTARRHGGLGLGLAIVKQLVEMHGGKVWVQSEGLGQGATFHVRLPLMNVCTESDAKHPHAVTSPALNQQLPSIALGGVHILIVDDEPDAREFVKRLLIRTGAQVSVAGSAREAFTQISAGHPDVLICDIGMPEEDGYALIRKLRQLGPDNGGATPAVALTAYARSEDRAKVIRAGFQNHLAKPVEPAELLAIVASLARR